MYTESWINNYWIVEAFALLLDLSSNIFCHKGDKSEHIKRPLYTSYPSNGLPLPSSSQKSIRGLITSTFHGIFRSYQLMIEPNIILLSTMSLRFPLLGRCRQLYTNFFASPHTELLVFPRSAHGTTRYVPNLDSAQLCQPASIIPACPRLLLFAIISAQHLYFPSTEVRSFSHHQTAAGYPQVSLLRSPRALFDISQHGSRSHSALSSTMW